jgi:hypothetical protein
MNFLRRYIQGLKGRKMAARLPGTGSNQSPSADHIVAILEAGGQHKISTASIPRDISQTLS